MLSAGAPVKYDTIARENFIKTMIMTKIRSTLTGMELLG